MKLSEALQRLHDSGDIGQIHPELARQLEDTLSQCREAMVMLAALAGSKNNRDIPWAQLDERARKLLDQ